jgi:hypothetical protein
MNVGCSCSLQGSTINKNVTLVYCQGLQLKKPHLNTAAGTT